ncbi:MAG: hypothetical protein GY800_14220 [Planctomycetes bacterium]|nr:hypothetical protein [Planctomycetota bacterium]
MIDFGSLTRRSFVKGSVLSILSAANIAWWFGADSDATSDIRSDTPSDAPGIEKAVVFPDIHIGWEESNVDQLLASWDGIVNDNGVKEVIFLGDVFDLWRDKELIGSHHGEFLGKLSELNGKGVKISYVVGNHDYQLVKILEGDSEDLQELVKKLQGCGVHFYHPHYQFKSGDRTIVATHGDTFDFLYWFMMLGLAPQPSVFYKEFYEEVYTKNQISDEFDQDRIARLVGRWFQKQSKVMLKGYAEAKKESFRKKFQRIKYIGKLFRPKEETEGEKLSSEPTEEQPLSAPAVRRMITLAPDLKELYHEKPMELRKIHFRKFSESFGWKGVDEKWKFYHPFPTEVDTQYFTKSPDGILMGHYHDPREFTHWDDGKLLQISDVGACAEGILTYATVTNGEIALHSISS